jgi:hypothetical protein
MRPWPPSLRATTLRARRLRAGFPRYRRRSGVDFPLFPGPSPRPFTVVFVTRRPLAIVSGLTLGDYLLWDWSLTHNHDVLAVVAGLTLPPLALAWLWLLMLTLVRFTARTSRRSSQRAAGRRARSARAPLPETAEPASDAGYGERPAAPAAQPGAPTGAPAPIAEQPSRRIAA